MQFQPKQLIGHTPCPECGERAEVKTDKSGNPYRWCPSAVCNAQYFTRGHPDRVKRLLAKTERVDQAQPAPEPEPAPAPEGAAKGGAVSATPAPAEPAKSPPKRGPFSTLLDIAGRS